MPWVELSSPFNFIPSGAPRTSIKYPVGVHFVKTECADRAIALGVAKRVRKPQADKK